MTAKAGALPVYEVVAFGQEVPNQCPLDNRKAFVRVLRGPSVEDADPNNPLSISRTLKMFHQRQIFALSPYATAQVIALADVKRLESAL